MDSAIQSEPEAYSEATGKLEIPVPVDAIALDGINPEVGDQVEISVGGPVKRVVNGIAYMCPETAQGQPLPATAIESKGDDLESEYQRLRGLSETVGRGEDGGEFDY